MYIEKNGYVLMNKDTMEFLVDFFENPSDTSGDIEEAYIYDDIEGATLDCKNINEELEDDIFEVVRYQKTIWLDKMFQENIKNVLEVGCCSGCENIEGSNK